MEQWKDIKGYEGLYQVSNLGNVKNIKTGRILKQNKNNNGYMQIDLHKNCKRKTHLVHRIVAEAFIPNPQNKETVDHINTLRCDNRVENLRWFTKKQQMSENEITKERIKKSSKENITKFIEYDKLNGYKKVKKNLKKAHEINKKKIINLDTNEIFESSYDAARKYLCNHSHITACCKYKRKTSGGYHWAYYNETGGEIQNDNS